MCSDRHVVGQGSCQPIDNGDLLGKGDGIKIASSGASGPEVLRQGCVSSTREPSVRDAVCECVEQIGPVVREDMSREGLD